LDTNEHKRTLLPATLRSSRRSTRHIAILSSEFSTEFHVTSAIASSDVAALVPSTPAARAALDGRNDVRIAKFPFNVGRESRLPNPPQTPTRELRLGAAPPLNDLYLLEPPWADLLHISREHFAIEREGDQFFVVDRGSVCGTIVAGKQIGGNRTGGRTELRNGDVIVVGTPSSQYAFRFEVATYLQSVVSVAAEPDA
jgi:hypothetical protein